ncbi:hypothetical protein GUITHDRAFT_149395 [Guillardia theta CCMP2712]|uniref:Uncharacterized protein n=1 Tax=Guillardia theta (strain CCMP2712) TaxID=905079 RepID=L1I4W6_GUITC|nr:hypothetical protein GUITHDRAFT_149395 [Guillardia theta CCMP2712]EKX31298.1 hypothetical protein GUITHDRAFT_149395 [Guillardia theta CCMP2712]|eukprot:XP_005818278.1 hypothetical protein GUITHDRAFT_149395 [Guillardia theta CCMP2712]
MARQAVAAAAVTVTIVLVSDYRKISTLQRRGYGAMLAAAESSPQDKLKEYQALNPTYGRCAKSVDMQAFSDDITKSCGNIHELSTCSYVCAGKMQDWTRSMGCCFETVMQAYQYAEPQAEQAWRQWQGTLSGKCGIVFEDEDCGQSVGEHEFNALNSKVDAIEDQAERNEDEIYNIAYSIYPPYYNNYNDYGSYYGYKGKASSLQSPRKALLSGNNLGDNVMDLPATKAEDLGDVHLPSENVAPYMYSKHKLDKNRALFQNAQRMKVASGSKLANAYDDYRNYQNKLRIDEAFRNSMQNDGPKNSFFNSWGESWKKSRGIQSLAAQGGKGQEANEEAKDAEEEEQTPLAMGYVVNSISAASTPSYGFGRAGDAGVDPINGRRVFELDPESDGKKNRLTPEAAVRQARFNANKGNAQVEEEKHLFGGTFNRNFDRGQAPRKDAGTVALEKAGVNV